MIIDSCDHLSRLCPNEVINRINCVCVNAHKSGLFRISNNGILA